MTLSEKIKHFKQDLETQDKRKYTMKEIKEILGERTIQEWREEK